MKNIKAFLLGIGTVLVFQPLMNDITEVVSGFLEQFKCINTIKVLEHNKKIQELQNDLEPVDTCCMGFQVPSVPQEEDEDWEEEEEKHKNKIGFRTEA